MGNLAVWMMLLRMGSACSGLMAAGMTRAHSSAARCTCNSPALCRWFRVTAAGERRLLVHPLVSHSHTHATLALRQQARASTAKDREVGGGGGVKIGMGMGWGGGGGGLGAGGVKTGTGGCEDWDWGV